MLTKELAERLFVYDPETGRFDWRTRPAGQTITNSIGAGGFNSEGYRVVRWEKRNYRVHRIIWLMTHGAWPVNDVDHINGDRSDNRICNLRSATRTQNNYNQRISSRNKSGHKGVSWCKQRDKWQVHIAINGKCTYVGRFKKLEDAANAYRKAAVSVGGEFARDR